MTLFIFDNTFEGLLTSVFEAYSRRTFPDALLAEGEPLPLFCDETFTVVSDEEKAGRVWRGLQKKLSASALSCLTQCWLAEEPETASLLFRYIRKAIDASRSIETNFADPDVLEFSRTYFAAVEPEKNVLPLITGHFKDRFADQCWLIYDIKRAYGYYYDLKEVRNVVFGEDSREGHLVTGILDESLMDKDEKLFQQLWKTYFKAICIKERLNPRKHRQDMPVRYWKYLTEKQT